ncbi:MAG TPA: hypothetical protein VMF52_08075 [Steroidobacteraceae bacterium]|nr:hypothetical protein [Steroidobacteraceae bacterium]
MLAAVAARVVADDSATRAAGEDLAVLKGAINHLCLKDDGRREIISDSPDEWGAADHLPDARLTREYGAQLSSRSAAKDSWPLASLCTNVSVIRGARIRAFFAKDRRIPPGWEGFEKEFGTRGYLTATRPVYSADRTRAIISLGSHCGELCGSGRVIELTRTTDGWRVLHTFNTWIS